MVLAITRSGKTEGLVVPSIDVYSRAEEKTSMVILDAKGNLSNTVIPRLCERGYQVYVLDFFEFKGHFYNPFHSIVSAYVAREYDMAEELCAALAVTLIPKKDVKDPYWVEAPRSLLVACVLGIVEDCVKAGKPQKSIPYSLFVFIATLGKINNEDKLKSKLDEYFQNRPHDNPAKLAFSSIEFSEGKTRSSVLSSMTNKIDLFRRPSLARMTSHNSFELTDIGFGEKPLAVILRVPFYTRTYDAMVSLFISQAFYLNMDKAAKENHNKCKWPVRVIGDEIFNFPPIQGLEQMLTVGLGANWGVDLYAQSYAQPEDMYGKTITKIIMENCATTYFLSSPSKDTREYVSELCGNRTITNVTRTGTRMSFDKQYTETFEEQRLIPAQELTELMDGEMVVFPTLHRRDCRGGKVVPLPIFNTGESSLLYRYQYLKDFDPDEAIPWNQIGGKGGEMKDIDLNDLVYLPGAASVLTMAEMLNETQLNTVATQIPSSTMIDFETVTIDGFTQMVDGWLNSGALDKIRHSSLLRILNQS